MHFSHTFSSSRKSEFIEFDLIKMESFLLDSVKVFTTTAGQV